jgi:hypothetical protein
MHDTLQAPMKLFWIYKYDNNAMNIATYQNRITSK